MSGPPPEPGEHDDLTTLATWLARRDREVAPYDAVVLLGSACLAAVEAAAVPALDGRARHLVVSGGTGHSTPYLVENLRRHPTWHDVPTEGRAEAEILGDVLVGHLGVDRRRVVLETRAGNCGENATFTRELLRRRRLPHSSLLLVQDPTLQQRTHACFRRALGAAARVTSRAPFVPSGVVGPDGLVDATWTPDRFRTLLLGEVRRLHDTPDGHGPLGARFVGHVDVPSPVLDAADRLRRARPDLADRPER